LILAIPRQLTAHIETGLCIADLDYRAKIREWALSISPQSGSKVAIGCAAVVDATRFGSNRLSHKDASLDVGWRVSNVNLDLGPTRNTNKFESHALDRVIITDSRIVTTRRNRADKGSITAPSQLKRVGDMAPVDRDITRDAAIVVHLAKDRNLTERRLRRSRSISQSETHGHQKTAPVDSS